MCKDFFGGSDGDTHLLPKAITYPHPRYRAAAATTWFGFWNGRLSDADRATLLASTGLPDTVDVANNVVLWAPTSA